MARANKYTSINFNHIYEKNPSNNNTNPTKHQTSSAASFYSAVSSPNGFNNATTRTHGRMLLLTRPTSKPITTPQLSPSPQPQLPSPQKKVPDHPRSEPDSISLRPLGRIGAASGISAPVLGQEKEREVGAVVGSPKPNRFVPPHLRPGFVGKEERPGPEVFRAREPSQSQRQQGNFGSPGRNNENGRPKSGGYDRMRVGESDLGLASRPRSSGNRPCSRGWYFCFSQFDLRL